MKNRGDRGRPKFRDDRRGPHRRDEGRGAPPNPREGDRNQHPAGHPARHPEHHEATRTDLVFGIEPVRELIAAAPGSIRTLYVRTGDGQRFEEEMDAVRIAGGQVAFAEEAEISRNCGRDARHQGIAAVVREYAYTELEDMIEAKPDPILIIDGVTDPRNLGAILRSAEGAGVGNIVIAKDHTVGYDLGGDQVVSRRVDTSQNRTMRQRCTPARGSKRGGLLDCRAGAGRQRIDL